jgi:hypothetical protein
MKKKLQDITVNTPVGILRAVESGDPNYPGIVLEIVKDDGTIHNCALLEANENKEVRLLVWGDENKEDFTHKFAFSHAVKDDVIEKFPFLKNEHFWDCPSEGRIRSACYTPATHTEVGYLITRFISYDLVMKAYHDCNGNDSDFIAALSKMAAFECIESTDIHFDEEVAELANTLRYLPDSQYWKIENTSRGQSALALELFTVATNNSGPFRVGDEVYCCVAEFHTALLHSKPSLYTRVSYIGRVSSVDVGLNRLRISCNVAGSEEYSSLGFYNFDEPSADIGTRKLMAYTIGEEQAKEKAEWLLTELRRAIAEEYAQITEIHTMALAEPVKVNEAPAQWGPISSRWGDKWILPLGNNRFCAIALKKHEGLKTSCGEQAYFTMAAFIDMGVLLSTPEKKSTLAESLLEVPVFPGNTFPDGEDAIDWLFGYRLDEKAIKGIAELVFELYLQSSDCIATNEDLKNKCKIIYQSTRNDAMERAKKFMNEGKWRGFCALKTRKD